MKDSPELRAAIRAASAFRELSDDNLALLIEAAELETFDPDAVLMVQGDPSDYAMLILEGEVTVTADSARGAIPISTLHAPSLVGELGALAQLPRSATARACTPVTALRFGRAALVEVARATPSLLIDVIGRMGERLRKFNGAISLYTEALGALEHHELDPALLEELRNPIPDLADFGQTFGRMAEQLILRRQRDDEMASAAVIQRALLPRVKRVRRRIPPRCLGGDDAGARRRRRFLRTRAACRRARRARRRRRLRQRACLRLCSWASPRRSSASTYARIPICRERSSRRTPFSPTTTPASCSRPSYTPLTIRARARSNIAIVATFPGLIRRPGGAVETLPVGGLPVGLFEPMKMTVHRAELRPGDLFFLYTDGVTEAEDPDALQFGEDRLEGLLAKKGHGASASQWIARIEAAVRAFARGRSQFDDITCLALRR